MKKIAVMMESWGRYFTYAWVSGMLKRIKADNEEINLYIFNASANWGGDPLYNQGEYNIFTLPDFKAFDGVVIDINNTTDEQVKHNLIGSIRASGVPAIVIGNKIDGFYSVGVDNYAMMQKNISHLYDVHNCRTFWFVMGPEENYENQCRGQALLDFAAAHGLKQGTDYEMCYSGYDVIDGADSFKKLYSGKESLPDAIVCANDNLAVGFLTEAEKSDISCPQDFLITGFDDLDKARFYKPRISTVSYIREDAGEKCIEILEKLWKGIEVSEENYISARTIYWESCGCESEVHVDERIQMKSNIIWSAEMELFERDVLNMSSRLTYMDSIEEMFAVIPESILKLNCDGVYIILDTNFNCEARNRKDIFMKKGYPEELVVAFEHHAKDGLTKKKNRVGQRIKGLFPFFESEVAGKNLLFVPLHFKDDSIGYLVIENAIYLMEQQFLFDIINALLSGLNHLYQKTQLAKMNKTLFSASIHDSMTGLYNRMGLAELGEKKLREIHQTGKRVLVLYSDLDMLKYLNDHYGHELGDMAIKMLAGQLESHTSGYGLNFRLGGDEFLTLDIFEGDDKVKNIMQEIRHNLSELTRIKSIPIELSASFGYVVAEREEGMCLDDYISKADDLMYEDKKMRKKERT